MERDPPSPLSRFAERADAFLARFSVRLVLSVLIVASLIPTGATATTDPFFLALFSVELGLRVLIVAGEARASETTEIQHARGRLGAVAFLVIDLVALLSFLPTSFGFGGSRFLRVFRLARLLLVFSYWAPVVRDIALVLSRRERAQKVALLGLVVALLAFAGATILDHIATAGVDFNEDGLVDAADDAFIIRFWWSFRQLQDPGNLVSAPENAVALAVSLALTVAGLLLVSFLIGLGTDVVRELLELSETRPVGLRKHFVIVHVTPGVARLTRELTGYHEKLFSRVHIVLAGDEPEMPPRLRAELSAAVHYRAHDALDGAGLVTSTDLARAKRVIVLARPGDPSPDPTTARVVLAAREANPRASIIAEVFDQSSTSALRVAGGHHTILVPTEKLLALHVVHRVRHPERAPIFRELLTTREGNEIYSFFFDYDGAPPLAPGPVSFDALYRRGLRRPGGVRVIPIGLGYTGGTRGQVGLALRLGAPAAPDDVGPDAPVRAVFAIAYTFGDVATFGEDLREHGGLAPRLDAARDDGPPRDPPALLPPRPATPLSRVLVCGYRPAVVELAKDLALACPDVAVDVLVTEDTLARAARRGLLDHGHPGDAQDGYTFGPVGCFLEVEPDVFTFHLDRVGPPLGRVTVRVADWTSERTLTAIPPVDRHLGEYDRVFLLGGVAPGLDERSVMTALKIADLRRAQPDRFGERFGLVVGARDHDLANRIARSWTAATGDPDGILVVPTEELRALFTFQATVVPGFDAVYSALLDPRGGGFEYVPVDQIAAAASAATWTFEELGRAFRARGRTLVAIDRRAADGELCRTFAPVQPEERAPFSAEDLVAVWLL
ncbi:MAG: hypothetical protein H6745_27890 [Deltaproteobacteria bacterium]|nr:hypothetical protein [Deltaproteobacteria bacterium]